MLTFFSHALMFGKVKCSCEKKCSWPQRVGEGTGLPLGAVPPPHERDPACRGATRHAFVFVCSPLSDNPFIRAASVPVSSFLVLLTVCAPRLTPHAAGHPAAGRVLSGRALVLATGARAPPAARLARHSCPRCTPPTPAL